MFETGGFTLVSAETNTSIRDGWFWRDEAQRVKTVDENNEYLVQLCRWNSVFLLNLP